jgi:MarR-like DNA-binding transcriptional regulator SgrR of sgrS sRNA
MQDLIVSTNVILEDWKQRKEEIAQCQKELTENQQCIDTLAKNFETLYCIERLQEIVAARNLELKKKIYDFEAVDKKLRTRHETMKNLMIEMLHLYNKINVVFTESLDEVVNDEKFAVEIARISYSNLVDNHSLRSDPPIATVLKDDFRYITDILS